MRLDANQLQTTDNSLVPNWLLKWYPRRLLPTDASMRSRSVAFAQTKLPFFPFIKSGFRQPELTTTPRSTLPPVRSAGSNDRQPPGFVSGAEPILSSGRPSSCIRMLLYSSSRSAQCQLNSSA